VPITAKRHAGTLAVFMATYTAADITGMPAALYIQAERITACTTLSAVLGKQCSVHAQRYINRQHCTQRKARLFKLLRGPF